jgi:hypothetical protein
MARRRRPVGPPTGWEISVSYTVNGRRLEPGTEVSIRGERGRFRFVKAVRTAAGAQWLAFIGGPPRHEQWRSFRPERVRTVHRITRTRANAA